MGVKSWIKQLLVEKENRKYERLLGSRKVSYGDWVSALERQQEGARVPGEPPDSCGIVIIRAGRGASASGMYRHIENYFTAHPEVCLLYGDEDVCDGAEEGKPVPAERRRFPWFKPDWSPDLLESCFYFGSVMALREELFDRTQAAYADICRARGEEPGQVWKSGQALESAQESESVQTLESVPGRRVYEAADFRAYEEWMHICVRLAGGWEKGNRAVGHLAQILFHCYSAEEQGKYVPGRLDVSGREPGMCPDAPGRRKCGASLDAPGREPGMCPNAPGRRGFGVSPDAPGRREPGACREQASGPMISIIIPSRDHPEILRKCLDGCVLAAEGLEGKQVPFEVILVDNGSGEENRKKIQKTVQEMTERGCRISYLYQPQDFNFSRLCNLGAAQAEGELLLFLNDDVELCSRGCLGHLATLAGREYTGAVGMKLYYPDSIRIQHAGITNLPMGPVHKLQFQEDDREYYYGANRGRRNVLAVTAACLMVEKKKYLEAGGFAEELRVAFNDVDFCFRLYELGYQNVCVNDLYGYHHESLSRGADEAPEKLERLLRERDILYGRHPELEGRDPYYSPHLNREGLDTGIRPAYLTAGNQVQKAVRPGVKSLKGYRQDKCLMVRVEDCRGGRLVGYGVVLGDDNACYERELLLWREEDGRGEEELESRAGGGDTGKLESRAGGGDVEELENRAGGGSAEKLESRAGGGAAEELENPSGGGAAEELESRAGGGSAEEPESQSDGGDGMQKDAAVPVGVVYALRLEGQYRPDLEENLPDQVHVALCGFLVEIESDAVPAGRYRLGMAVRNRVTGLKLVNWSGRTTKM